MLQKIVLLYQAFYQETPGAIVFLMRPFSLIDGQRIRIYDEELKATNSDIARRCATCG
jgi:hypothetical protein